MIPAITPNLDSIPQSRDAYGWFAKWVSKKIPLGSTPYEAIYKEPSLTLIKYVRPAVPGEFKRRHATPIVIVPSLINRHYVLDLLPGKSWVEYLLKEGFDVYLVRWEAPEDEDRWLTTDRLLGGRIHRAISVALKDAGTEKAHLMGQCLGGTLLTAYAIRYPERAASLSLITAPVDFKSVGQVAKWVASENFDVESFLEAYGNFPWQFMQGPFQLLRPAAGVTKFIGLAKRLHDKDFVQSFLAMEAWTHDNISYPGGCYQTVAQTFYRENGLKTGKLRVNGEKIRLSELKVPTISLSSADDHIVPSETTLQKEHLSPETHLTVLTSRGGHIGCLLGGKARKDVWPVFSEWIASTEATLQ